VEDITISIIEARHPRELLKYLEKQGGRASKTDPGIYHIAGYPLTIQVIESKKLPLEENLWLKGLAKDLNPAIAGSILKESRKKGLGTEFGAYLYALITANLKAVQEVIAMTDEALAFDKWVEEMGWAAKWEAQGKKTAWKEAIELLKQGYTVEELERMSPSSSPNSN
jgi:hypothetical protein